jgi:hypothetical protein
MANPEHLATLKRGVEEWNAWREKNREIQPNLSTANLVETDFSRAQFSGTILSNLDLSLSKGLETVDHKDPSTIGIDTIVRSQGKIPEVFLRGAAHDPTRWDMTPLETFINVSFFLY